MNAKLSIEIDLNLTKEDTFEALKPMMQDVANNLMGHFENDTNTKVSLRPETVTAVQEFAVKTLGSSGIDIDESGIEIGVSFYVAMFSTIVFIENIVPDLREQVVEWLRQRKALLEAENEGVVE